MRFEGTLHIAAPPEHVWDALADPQRVSQCAPEVESLDVKDQARFSMKARGGVGAVKGVFAFDVEFTDLRRPASLRAKASGRGAGSRVDLDSEIELASHDGNATALRWRADVAVSGLLASVGSRFVTTAAERTTRQVLECVKERVERG